MGSPTASSFVISHVFCQMLLTYSTGIMLLPVLRIMMALGDGGWKEAQKAPQAGCAGESELPSSEDGK